MKTVFAFEEKLISALVITIIGFAILVRNNCSSYSDDQLAHALHNQGFTDARSLGYRWWSGCDINFSSYVTRFQARNRFDEMIEGTLCCNDQDCIVLISAP